MCPEVTELLTTHYFIMKIPKKRELQQIASNHSSGIYFKDFMKLSKYRVIQKKRHPKDLVKTAN